MQSLSIMALLLVADILEIQLNHNRKLIIILRLLMSAHAPHIKIVIIDDNKNKYWQFIACTLFIAGSSHSIRIRCDLGGRRIRIGLTVIYIIMASFELLRV